MLVVLRALYIEPFSDIFLIVNEVHQGQRVHIKKKLIIVLLRLTKDRVTESVMVGPESRRDKGILSKESPVKEISQGQEYIKKSSLYHYIVKHKIE